MVAPASQFGTIANGSPAPVAPDLPGVDAVTAGVSLVDPLVDAPSSTFRVRLAIDNRDGTVPAGVRCKVDFGNTKIAAMRMHDTPAVRAQPAAR